MTHIGTPSFLLFLALVALSAFIFCLPQAYGWSWGVAIQLWALFGLFKLYGLSEPSRDGDAPQSLSARLRDTLFAKRERESEHVSFRLSRFDSMTLLIAGGLMVLWILMCAYTGITGEGALQRSLYTTLYLVAQIFCIGVIAFLAQLYAVREKFVQAGVGLTAICCTILAGWSFWHYGYATAGLDAGWLMAAPQGTDIYLVPHEGVSPFALRHRAMGAIGALLPWVALAPMAFSLLRVIMHPMRGKLIPALGLFLILLLGFYDGFAVRGIAHFAVILPAWAGLALAWGRSGYRPLWSPFGRASRHDIRTARHMADFQ